MSDPVNIAGEESRQESPNASGNSTEFLWNVHSYLNEYIRFCDTKAAVVIAWASAVMGALLGAKSHHAFTNTSLELRQAEWSTTVHALVVLLTFVLLGSAFVTAVVSILPRLWSASDQGGFRAWGFRVKHNPGMIYWEAIGANGSPDNYLHSIRQAGDDGMRKAISDHTFVLSGLCSRKYLWVTISILCALGGSILAAVSTLIYD